MIEFIGAIGILVGSVMVMAYFWRRRTFTGGENVETWGITVDGLPLEPHFTGATSANDAMTDAQAMARAVGER